MSGPFKLVKFFLHAHEMSLDRRQIKDWVKIANTLDAQRWACSKGGEHEHAAGQIDHVGDDIVIGIMCAKCGEKLRARWEAV